MEPTFRLNRAFSSPDMLRLIYRPGREALDMSLQALQGGAVGDDRSPYDAFDLPIW